MRRTLVLVLGVFAFTVFPCRVESATVLALTVEELAAGSDRVVRARVSSQETEVDRSGGWVYRLTTLEVIEDIAGDGPTQVVVRQLGGEDTDEGLFVEGDAVFGLGEEVVVFLREGGQAGRLVHLEGLSLGKFRVERSEDASVMALRDLSGLHLIRPQGVAAPLERRVSLDELRHRVRGVSVPRQPDPEDDR